jgi:hypothetical protein
MHCKQGIFYDETDAMYFKYSSMNRFTVSSVVFLSFLCFKSYSQQYITPSKLPSLALGAGVLYFNGDIGKGTGVTPYATIRPGVNFTIEERPISFLGFSLTGLYGSLSASERSTDSSNNLNFETKIFSGDLMVNLHLDGLLLPGDAPIAPFIYAGVSYMYYNPYADLKDAQGYPYYYWTDGTIRNEPQNSADLLTAKIVNRDYVYETPLDSGKYNKYTFCVPVGLGLKFRVSENFFMNVQATYYFTFSPNIDNYKLSGKDNKFLYSFFTLEYHFGGEKDKRMAKYEGVDFKKLIKEENKPVTKAKEEPKEVPMSDSAIAAQYAKDTLAVDRSEVFNENPSMQALTNIDKLAKKHNLPDKFKSADKNGDGIITSQEITQAIDEFFDGSSNMTIQDINALIDYFFDQ